MQKLSTMLILKLSINTMKKKRGLKKFIEQDMGNILREKLSPEEFNAVMQGIFMVMDEVAAGNITTVYDVMDMAARFTKPPCSGCKELEQLTRLAEAQDRLIKLQFNDEAPMRIVG